ncbi:hypothetical protein EON64_12210, partial [archaeon]
TSFTRIFADSIFAGCWVFTGGWLNDTASTSAQCSASNVQLLASTVQLIPLTIRGLQCMRVLRDHQFTIYPYFFNLFKYMLSIIVVVAGITVQSSNNNQAVLAVIIFSTLYKWWWDVVMDWGLCEILPSWPPWASATSSSLRSSPSPKLLLRHLIMYPSLTVYYVAIFADLLMRFMWTLSLISPDSGQRLVGYQFSFFLGTIEILRRGMWACFRIEYEHLKSLKAGKAGFLSTTVVRKYFGSGGVYPAHSAHPVAPGRIGRAPSVKRDRLEEPPQQERGRKMSVASEDREMRNRSSSLASRSEHRMSREQLDDELREPHVGTLTQVEEVDDEENRLQGLHGLPDVPEGSDHAVVSHLPLDSSATSR